MNVVIFGHGTPVLNAIKSLLSSSIKILNVEQDYSREGEEQTDFVKALEVNSIQINSYKEIIRSDIDIILVINYNRLIPEHLISKVRSINLHMGILPLYRGNNANAWAVINGEKQVGYSLHNVTDMLDAGDIYYTFVYTIGNDPTYLEAKKAIETDIRDNLGAILVRIYKNEILPKSQLGSEFMYCVKLRPSDGFISNWNISTDLILRKNYVFGRPLGTGLKFKHKDQTYEIGIVQKVPNYKVSVGVPGSVVYLNEEFIWVKTSDSVVALSDVRCDSNVIEISKIFKIGMRLG